MPDVKNTQGERRWRIRHRGRISQIGIYLLKMLRMFVYQSDWKVLPMAALIAGLVGIVVRRRFFVDMEGSLMGSFALACVCIWNGGFNSIQVICRERDVIKREHRSGMHISSYIVSHMIYQALLCLAQTGVTLYITMKVGVKYPVQGLITNWFLVDFGISMFLITFASDMLSLWISSLSRNTTTAMTIMPFVLIFQLVFSGGMLTLPAWTNVLTPFTISNPGLKVIATQADVNNRPFMSISNMIVKMRDSQISVPVTVGEVLDLARREDIDVVARLREVKVEEVFGVDDVYDTIAQSPDFKDLENEVVAYGITVGEMTQLLEQMSREDKFQTLFEKHKDTTVGEILDGLIANPKVQALRDRTYTVTATVGQLLDLAGEENVKTFLQEKAGEASYKAEYEMSKGKIAGYWMHLCSFVILFALLAMITLEFIDKDRR